MLAGLNILLGRSPQKPSYIGTLSTTKPFKPTVRHQNRFSVSLLLEEIDSLTNGIDSSAATNGAMSEDENTNKTFAIVKPDALTPFKYQQIDALIKLNEFEITRQKLVWLTPEQADALFPERSFDQDHAQWVEYITSAPSLALELTKPNATLYWQIAMGSEFSAENDDRDDDSIRGILAIDRIRNAVDGSEEPENAVKQLELVFSDRVPEIPYDNFLMMRAVAAHNTLAMIKPDVSLDKNA
ncbi:hypothetical protein EC988_006777, partial [Linderina pennispora]